MLPFRVFATHQSRSSLPAPSLFLPSSPSTLFFSDACRLTYTTAISQPFVYQSLPHTFHHDGWCTPSRHHHLTKIPSPQVFWNSVLTNRDARNSFRICSYENCRVTSFKAKIFLSPRPALS